MTSKVALVMGVANRRSIAWNCVESLIKSNNNNNNNSDRWEVIFTYQDPKMESRVRPLLESSDQVTGAFAYNVHQEGVNNNNNNMMMMSSDFSQRLSDLLQDRPLNAVVHSLAHAPNLKTTTSLLQTTLEDYLATQHISAYSLIDIARETRQFMHHDDDSGCSSRSSSSSITALTYLGAVRAVPGYHAMGPAKASLESIVRGLALELAENNTRVNAVSAGPLPTLAAKGGIANFDSMRREMEARAPLGNVTAEEVANTVSFLASSAGSGITGQTIYVDGGYSIVGGPPPPSAAED